MRGCCLTQESGEQRARGFTIVELLTVIAVMAVMATLVSSALANARVRSEQLVCQGNLRQVLQAIEMYSRDTGKRPRSLSRVIQHLPAQGPSNIFICPSDPALRRSITTNLFWGNVANASQEPWAGQNDLRDPESGSWTAELAEVNETEPFSYLHSLSWRRAAWQRLAILGAEAGTVICQLHGVRVPAPAAVPNYKHYLQYEGLVFRAVRDGSVVKRRVFRPGSLGEGSPGSDYPWEFYSDALLPPVR
jgi:prepilin-type N-terminal cleavage/methylation domain-containing protein